jgi:hypothetical protein
MTSEETLQLVAMISEFYPSFYKGRDFRAVAGAWHRLLENVPYGLAVDALRSYILSDTKGFAPTPGSIVEQLEKKAAEDYLSEADAWDLVLRAVSRSGYNAREEFDKLPPILQQVVGTPYEMHEWSNLTTSEFNTYIANHIRRLYREAVQRDIHNRFHPKWSAALPAPEPLRLE